MSMPSSWKTAWLARDLLGEGRGIVGPAGQAGGDRIGVGILADDRQTVGGAAAVIDDAGCDIGPGGVDRRGDPLKAVVRIIYVYGNGMQGVCRVGDR